MAVLCNLDEGKVTKATVGPVVFLICALLSMMDMGRQVVLSERVVRQVPVVIENLQDKRGPAPWMCTTLPLSCHKVWDMIPFVNYCLLMLHVTSRQLFLCTDVCCCGQCCWGEAIGACGWICNNNGGQMDHRSFQISA